MTIEYEPIIIEFKKGLKIMLVEGVENARLILGTIVGSIFSLMVFSFSMVMLVLNRASSTLSPRVIPGLITQKSHQIVLGVYLGTIIYSLILIINIQSIDDSFEIPTLGILISMIFAITCLGLFVYFIHSISRSIQVDNILQSIFKKSLQKIRELHIPEGLFKMPVTDGWHSVFAANSGYLKRIEKKSLVKICKENNISIRITENLGFFFVKGYPIAKVSNEVSEDVHNDILNCFIFYIEEHVSDHYSFGFKQISEIAVKALSPGINDPGTAIKAIDMLSVLFIEKMHINEENYLIDNDGKLLVFFESPSLEQLLFTNLSPIREYGKHDVTIMLNLLESLKNLIYADREKREFQNVLSKYTQDLINSSVKYIENDIDIEQINNYIDRINLFLVKDFSVTNSFVINK